MFIGRGYGSGLQGDSDDGRDRERERAQGTHINGTHINGTPAGGGNNTRGVKSPMSIGTTSRR